jgi:hypothetical protein
MNQVLSKGDVKILTEVAEKKYLTPLQISMLLQRGEQGTRRSLRILRERRLIAVRERSISGKKGRKGYVICLKREGLENLRGEGSILSKHADYSSDETPNILSIEHEIDSNWFHIAIKKVTETNGNFRATILTTSTHNLTKGSPQKPFIMETFSRLNSPEKEDTLIPDAVFIITDKRSGKALLFFLEVDMGTETLVSPSGKSGNLLQKIRKYQALFAYKGYKKYNSIANYELKGFRLLFLIASKDRMNSVCKLVQQTPPSDFIWVTNKMDMLSKGVSAKIWARGGKTTKQLESILGNNYAFNSPIKEFVCSRK